MKSDQSVYLAVKLNKTARVKELLASGANPNWKCIADENACAIHVAASGPFPEALATLLANDLTDVRATCDKGRTAAHHLALGVTDDAGESKLGSLELLLRFGCDLAATDRAGKTATYYALSTGQKWLARAMLKADTGPPGYNPELPIGPWHRLHCAAASDFFEEACLLVNRGIAHDLASPERVTPLHCSAFNSTEKISKLLVAWGTLVGVEDSERRTPLHYAAAAGSTEVASFLLSRGAAVDSADSAGMTPFHHAVSNGEEDAAVFFLERGADVNASADTGVSTLALALGRRARLKRPQLVQSLSSRGARIDARDAEGRTPLMHAVRDNLADAASFLLEHGAEVDCASADGTTPVHLASTTGNTRLLSMLLGKLSPEQQRSAVRASNKLGQTPLHVACMRPDARDILAALLAAGAEADSADAKGMTPLLTASLFGNADYVSLLLSHNAQIDPRSSDGLSAVHYACCSDADGVLPLLAERGVSLHAKDNAGRSPLHLAALNGSDACLRLLCADAAVAVNEQDSQGKTALMNAVISGSLDCVTHLLAKKPALERKDVFGYTALHHAAALGRSKIASALLSAGADVAATNLNGETPDLVAFGTHHNETARLLWEGRMRKRSSKSVGQQQFPSAKPTGRAPLRPGYVAPSASSDSAEADETPGSMPVEEPRGPLRPMESVASLASESSLSDVSDFTPSDATVADEPESPSVEKARLPSRSESNLSGSASAEAGLTNHKPEHESPGPDGSPMPTDHAASRKSSRGERKSRDRKSTGSSGGGGSSGHRSRERRSTDGDRRASDAADRRERRSSKKASKKETKSDNAKHEKTKKYLTVAVRLDTFRLPGAEWPHALPTAEMCADAGLYFSPDTSKPDRVKCSGCFRAIYGWTRHDDPASYMRTTHWKANPTCPAAIANVEAWKVARNTGGRSGGAVPALPLKTVWERARTPVAADAEDQPRRQAFLSSATQRMPIERRKSQPPPPVALPEDDDKSARITTSAVGGTSRVTPLSISLGERKPSFGASAVTPLNLASLSVSSEASSSANGTAAASASVGTLQTPKGPPPVSIATPSMRSARAGSIALPSLPRSASGLGAAKPPASKPVDDSPASSPAGARRAADGLATDGPKMRKGRPSTITGVSIVRPRYAAFVEPEYGSEGGADATSTPPSPDGARELRRAALLHSFRLGRVAGDAFDDDVASANASAGSDASRRDAAVTRLPRAVVRFDYVPQGPGELALKVGDTVTVLQVNDDGWWGGALLDKLGYFPETFVEVLSN